MKVSVFTPLTANGNQYIREAYESLCAQTHDDWEWVVLENHGGELPEDIARDKRVRNYISNFQGVGSLKRQVCQLCNGEILFELDHDDLLHSRALMSVDAAVSAGADFVYSDFAEFKVTESGAWEPNVYRADCGWKSYPVEFQGHHVMAHNAPTDPIAWRRIEWAPNHLRAWRRSFYEQIGGHDASLVFADDHDLVLRSYLAGGRMVHVPECLYFYRVHATNNVATRNGEIQAIEATVYDRYIQPLAEKIARSGVCAICCLSCNENGKPRLIDLCGGIDTAQGYEPWDITLGHDLNTRWPAEDSTVGVIRAFDAIEHLEDKAQTMNEAWRVLAPGGVLLVLVPSADAMIESLGEGRSQLVNGSGAYCDPTHVSYWNEMSFRYYTDRNFARYVPASVARFQVSRLRTVNRGGIPYVQAELIALKPGYEPMGFTSI